jgi:hypothetical protein
MERNGIYTCLFSVSGGIKFSLAILFCVFYNNSPKYPPCLDLPDSSVSGRFARGNYSLGRSVMATSNGGRGGVYDQVLEQARREIDEASSKIDEVRRTLHLMEARAEAAKAVYEAVAARLNLEDELQVETDFQEAPYPDTPPPAQAPEPPEEAESPEVPPNGQESGFSMDLIRRHLEQKSCGGLETEAPEPEMVTEPPVEEQIVQSVASQDPEAEPATSDSSETKGGAFPELSEAERRLIEEHMRSRAEAERRG